MPDTNVNLHDPFQLRPAVIVEMNIQKIIIANIRARPVLKGDISL